MASFFRSVAHAAGRQRPDRSRIRGRALDRAGRRRSIQFRLVVPENAIASVRSLQPVQDSSQPGEVRIVLDETSSRVVTGKVSDANIQRLILAAAHDENNPAVRWVSVDLLKNQSDSSQVRELLLNRVAEDPNAGVRLKALDGLKAYTGDPAVRNVLAHVLMHDDSPGVRIAAVDALTAHADDNMVGVLQSVVQNEGNTYVRGRCVKALRDLNASVGTF